MLALKGDRSQMNEHRGAVRNAICNHRSMHLEESKLYDARARCPICHYAGERDQGLQLQSSPIIRLLHCPACSGRSAAWMPRPEVLQDYYSGYFDPLEAAEKNGAVCVTFHGIERFARHLLRAMPVPAGDTPFRILDFGGGDGSLALEVAKLLEGRAVAITLVDYQEPRATPVPERISITHAKDLREIQENVAGQKFDIVLASAIAEHIPELNGVLQMLFGLLKPRGYFYARTPFMSSLIRFFPFVDFAYPAHVHDLGASFWNRITKTFNLKADILVSRPSIVESEWRSHTFRTLVAKSLKLPAHIEGKIAPRRMDRWWNLVGGWEVVLRASA
jgi:2-polyprenyl-3-methyl-5-hydroxy-6-metoxy-1,4-benzoquinol methylase